MEKLISLANYSVYYRWQGAAATVLSLEIVLVEQWNICPEDILVKVLMEISA